MSTVLVLTTSWLSWLAAAAGGTSAPTAPAFEEAAQALGVDFVHFNGMTGRLYTAEVVGPGVALFDYDNDGDLDIYLGQGRGFEGDEERVPVFAFEAGKPPGDRIFRNDLEGGAAAHSPDEREASSAGAPGLHFVDVTVELGLDAPGYNLGAATGDYDRDGYVDLYVTNLGSNQLLRNNGGTGFEDVTDRAGVDDRRFSVPATFFDYDADGWLDLHVGNYHRFHRANRKRCFLPGGKPDYCGPLSQPAEGDRLLRNLGNGAFLDVTESSGLAGDPHTALGAAAADFNGDGLVDLYVANDQMANQLWLNQGDGTFVEDAVFAGAAFDRDGRAQASMGVAIADFDGNGAPDIFLSHLVREYNTLYLNDGAGLFADRSREGGLVDPSWTMTGFGAAPLDYDGDGVLDLFVVNGAVRRIEEQVDAGEPHPLRMENQLFRGTGGGRFEVVPAPQRERPVLSEVSRGLAVGDLDNDGDPDLVITNNGGRARVLLNRRPPGRAWLGVRLVAGVGGAGIDAGTGAGGGPAGEAERRAVRRTIDVYGARARVTAESVEGQSITGQSGWQWVHTDGSYAAASDPRLLFSLGDGLAPANVEVVWPDGLVEEFSRVEPNRYHVLQRGSGSAVEKP